jgi:HD-GYP domain-containing protein (c-di-GMP phosphodiesterase class II)
MDCKVSTAYLKVGMYISKLDRPWKKTPFLIQGFHIKDEEDICALVKFCEFVYIDTIRGVTSEMYMQGAPSKYLKQSLSRSNQVESILDSGKKTVDYDDEKTTVEELPEAKAAFEHASDCVARIVEEDLKKGQLNIANVKRAVAPIVDSMVRNSDAFMWLAKMRNHDAASYDHSVQNCALGIAFGRHLGLNKRALNTFATGLLLMDVGKIKLPKQLLTKTTELLNAEEEILRKHVAFTVEILRKTKGINEHVINIALTHHERYDGSGYPNGLVGMQTPAYGRMAAIIDCYDVMITATSSKEAMPEHEALQNIYNMRDQSFQKELVEQFIQCMGVYPTGSLVELSTGAVGAVLAQNAQQKLKPKVIVLLDEKKRHIKKRTVCDLASQNKEPIHIAKSLENNAYGMDLKQVRF